MGRSFGVLREDRVPAWLSRLLGELQIWLSVR